MEDDTKRRIGTICGLLCFAIATTLFFLKYELFIAASILVGLGIVLLIRYAGDFPCPWELRVHYPGGGD